MARRRKIRGRVANLPTDPVSPDVDHHGERSGDRDQQSGCLPGACAETARRAVVIRLAALLTLISAVSGCSLLRPHLSSPVLPETPTAWTTADPGKQGFDATTWRNEFADPVLAALIEEAVGNNFDLRSAAARINAARANATISGADRAPQIAASLNANRARRSTVVGGTVVSGIGNYFQTGLEIRWEADIWGRLGHQARAATLELAASEADYHAARLSLAANIGRSWFNSIEAQQQVELSRQTVTNYRQALERIRESYRAGLSSALDLRLARSNLASAESQLAAQQARLDGQLRTLQPLLGRYPSRPLALADTLPALHQPVPAGLPSGRLARRPDLIAAQQRLRAADERTSQAAKNRLPRIQLTASGGTGSDQLNDLLDGDRLIWSIVGGITAPLFQGGRLKANQELARANADQALNQYAQTLLDAFREVETALAATPLLETQQQALQKAVEEAQESEQLAAEQYRAGLVDITTWLEAQRRLFTARSSLLQIRNQRLQNRINLHLALGGDFVAGAEAE